MSWEDRDYADDPWRKLGKPGGDWQGLRPTLDNPMSWSVKLFTAWAIDVRVHLVFILYIVIEMLRPLAGAGEGEATPLSFGLMGIVLVSLFGVVLLHEFGHCIACRRAGGTANEILMWPLGGLAYCNAGHDWRRHFVTAAGGPMVNVLILAVLGPLLGVLTGQWWQVALPNPVYPLNGMIDPAVRGSWLLLTLAAINGVSFILLLFNLLPMFPLDGGRLLQASLWPRFGYANSMRFAVRTGFIGAVLLGVVGFVLTNLMLVGVAIFGGITCWITHKQLEFTQGMLGGEQEEYATSVFLDPDSSSEPEPTAAKPSRAVRKAEKRAREAREEQEMVDGILAKIAEQGMDSLSPKERKLLKRATERSRNQHS